MMWKTGTLIGIVIFAGSLPAMCAEGLPIAPFRTHYDVYASGFSVGEATITLTAGAKPGTYHMESETRPNGLAGLLVSGRIHETVSGTWQSGVLQPSHYERVLETAKKSSRMQVDFDWSAGRLHAQQDADRETLPLTADVLDPLSLQLRLMYDVQQGHIANQYRVVDKTEIKTYAVRNEGEMLLETALGTVRTVQIRQYTPGKTRHTTFWVAPDRHALVRIQQDKDAKEVLRMDIRN